MTLWRHLFFTPQHEAVVYTGQARLGIIGTDVHLKGTIKRRETLADGTPCIRISHPMKLPDPTPELPL